MGKGRVQQFLKKNNLRLTKQNKTLNCLTTLKISFVQAPVKMCMELQISRWSCKKPQLTQATVNRIFRRKCYNQNVKELFRLQLDGALLKALASKWSCKKLQLPPGNISLKVLQPKCPLPERQHCIGKEGFNWQSRKMCRPDSSTAAYSDLNFPLHPEFILISGCPSIQTVTAGSHSFVYLGRTRLLFSLLTPTADTHKFLMCGKVSCEKIPHFVLDNNLHFQREVGKTTASSKSG